MGRTLRWKGSSPRRRPPSPPGRARAHRRLVADHQRAGLSPVLAPWLNSPRACFGAPGHLNDTQHEDDQPKSVLTEGVQPILTPTGGQHLTAAAAVHLATGYEGMYGDGFEALHPDPVTAVLIAELDPDLILTVLLAAVPDAQPDVFVTLARVAGAATNPQTAVERPFASDLLGGLETAWEALGSALASRVQKRA